MHPANKNCLSPVIWQNLADLDLLSCIAWKFPIFVFSFQTKYSYVAQVGSCVDVSPCGWPWTPDNLWLQHPKCCDYKQVPPCPAFPVCLLGNVSISGDGSAVLDLKLLHNGKHRRSVSHLLCTPSTTKLHPSPFHCYSVLWNSKRICWQGPREDQPALYLMSALSAVFP